MDWFSHTTRLAPYHQSNDKELFSTCFPSCNHGRQNQSARLLIQRKASILNKLEMLFGSPLTLCLYRIMPGNSEIKNTFMATEEAFHPYENVFVCVLWPQVSRRLRIALKRTTLVQIKRPNPLPPISMLRKRLFGSGRAEHFVAISCATYAKSSSCSPSNTALWTSMCFLLGTREELQSNKWKKWDWGDQKTHDVFYFLAAQQMTVGKSKVQRRINPAGQKQRRENTFKKKKLLYNFFILLILFAMSTINHSVARLETKKRAKKTQRNTKCGRLVSLFHF